MFKKLLIDDYGGFIRRPLKGDKTAKRLMALGAKTVWHVQVENNGRVLQRLIHALGRDLNILVVGYDCNEFHIAHFTRKLTEKERDRISCDV